MKPLFSIMLPLLIVLVLGVSGCTQYGQTPGDQPPPSGSGEGEETPPADAGTGSDGDTETPPEDNAPPSDNQTGDELPAIPATHTVEITDAGFVPSALTIAAGDTVTWTNMAGSASWPASAFHPTHTAYPGSDAQKCGTADEGQIFDACRDLQSGDSWSFTFTEVGTWHYHDHDSPSRTGTIVVE